MNGNVEFSYLYRDAANYKAWSSVVFANPSNVNLEEIERQLRRVFDGEELFIAAQVRLPEVFLYIHGVVTKDDHCYHEFDSVRITEEVPNDLYNRSIWQFIEEVEEKARSGWQAFDPKESRSTQTFKHRSN